MKTLFFLCLVAAVCLADSSFDSLADVEAHIKNHTIVFPFLVCIVFAPSISFPKMNVAVPSVPFVKKKCLVLYLPVLFPHFAKSLNPPISNLMDNLAKDVPNVQVWGKKFVTHFLDRIALVENEQSDLSIKQPVACPLFKCARPACTKTIPTTFNLNGKICNGCPKCAEKLEEIAEQEPALPSCPHIRCAIPKCEPGVKLVYSTLTFGGKKCRGCATCEKKQELRGCPHIKCAMPMCKPGTKLVYSTIMFAGKPCRGCARCAEPENNVACPMPKCAMIACEKSEPTTFEFKGKTCKGCPRCVRN